MKHRERKQRLVSEINITPFTDVILVLLIIFMITTPLISQASLKVDLPQATNVESLSGASEAIITMTSEGPVYLKGELVSREELKDKLTLLHKENSQLKVVLESDRLVKFNEIVSVLDIVTGIGVQKLEIAATKEP
jgi:biopolymer transport protein TolR